MTKSFVDQNLDKEVKGTATREPSGVKVELEKPDQQKLDLGTTQFPTQHLHRLIDKADKGETFYETNLFDGSEDADKAMTTTVIIGKQAEGTKNDPEPPALASLDKEKFWPVDIAYFDEQKKGGEELPEYRISFKMHENGLTRDLVMDYGDFSMKGKLVNLSLFDVEACRSSGGMAVYVDDAIWRWVGKRWCPAGRRRDELHRFAARLGVHRLSIKAAEPAPHYDLPL